MTSNDIKRIARGFLPLFLVATVVMWGARALAAQAATAAAAGSPGLLSPMDLQIIGYVSAAIIALGQIVDPANSSTKFGWTIGQRTGAFAVIGAIVGIMHQLTSQPGTPWTQSLMTGFSTFAIPVLGHFLPTLIATLSNKVSGAALVLVCVGTLGFGSSGCSVFAGMATSNPVVDATAFEQAASVADDIAKGAFAIALPLLPAADQVTAQADFAKAQSTYADAMTALSDGVQAYQDGTSQNWGALYTDVQNAVDAVVAAVDLFAPKSSASSAAPAAASGGFAAKRAQLGKAAATVHHYH